MQEENIILQAINKLVLPQIEKLNDKVDNVMLPQIEKLTDKVDNVVLPQMKEMQEEIRRISKTVAKIEVEHGKKLEALFDAFSMNSEKIESNAQKIKMCETRLDKQEDEIYYLSSKV